MELDRVALDLPKHGALPVDPALAGRLGFPGRFEHQLVPCELARNAYAPGYLAIELVLDNPRGGVPSELQRWATDSDPWEVRAPARTIAEWPETLMRPAIPLSSWCSTIPGGGAPRRVIAPLLTHPRFSSSIASTSPLSTCQESHPCPTSPPPTSCNVSFPFSTDTSRACRLCRR